MTEEVIKKVVRNEIETAIDIQNKRFDFIDKKLVEQKDEFVREVGIIMEESLSQVRTAIEWMQGMHENHEKRIIALEEKVS
jgi:hypothetical protein